MAEDLTADTFMAAVAATRQRRVPEMTVACWWGLPGTLVDHWRRIAREQRSLAVAEADASAAKVTMLGGSILAEPFDTPVGRIAVVRDPQGAVLSIIQPASQPA